MAKEDQFIVLVDDEPNILSALKRELRDWATGGGYTIQPFTSAKDALTFIEREANRVAIIVSDLRMPEMKGSDFLLSVKDRWPKIPSLLLSGYSEAEELMKAVKAGISSYILKPWDRDYLRLEMEKAMEARRIREENALYLERMKEELRWAGQFQRNFLKPTATSMKGLELQSTWTPVEGLYCGGDYFDIISLGPKRQLLVMGDVSGHGIKAALFTGFLKAMIFPEYVSPFMGEEFSPGAFLSWLNERTMYELRLSQSMILTFWAAVIDLEEGTLCYANAGHPKPFLIRGGVPQELTHSNAALCFSEDQRYTEQTESIEAGDTLVLFTDGLVELGAESAAEDIRLGSLLAEIPYGQDYHRRIMDRCLSATGRDRFIDDVTLLTARIL